MTATTTQPAPITTPNGGDQPIHLTCCDDNLAMCGTNVSGDLWVEPEDPGDECRLCVYINDEGLPCPLPGCTGGDE